MMEMSGWSPRKAAKKAGRKTYLSGKPCPHGHDAPRFVSNFQCSECERARKQKRLNAGTRKAFSHDIPEREAARLSGDLSYFTGKPCIHGHIAKRLTGDGKCYECHRLRTLAKSRMVKGIPMATRPMPDTCECCILPPGKKGLAIDHDHETGKFRGWLCGRCNTGIGLLRDRLSGVLRATAYLERSI